MIRTTSMSPQGHYRAGVFHSPQGSEWPDERFTDEELKLLEGDPRLTVEALDGEPSGQPPARALPPGASGGDAGYLERKADLDAREGELNKRVDAFNDLAADVATREAKVSEREQAVANRQAALDEMFGNETFRAIALRFAVRRVVEGKAEGDLLKDGKPKTEAVEREALGLEISAKERDALFAELIAAQG